jgi:NAD(P)-dependent dehydrogenase (short-subunit alcohol dehydrogenase family)
MNFIAILLIALVVFNALFLIWVWSMGRGARKALPSAPPPAPSPPSSGAAAGKDFAGQVAIITGGGSGLGREIAKNLAARGASVVITSRDLEKLKKVVTEIEAAGGTALAISTDVRDTAQVDAMVRQAVERFGRIDILVNNAAGNFFVPAEKLTPNGWNAVVGIVLNGTFYCTRAVAAEMIKQRRGSVVNIVANYAESGAPGVVHSASAKAGVLVMTKTLAGEWGRYGIRVNAMAPGAMVTENASKNLMYNTPEMQEKIRSRVPLGRLTSPEEMAQLVVFLCSKDAEYIQGHCLTADGGAGLSRGLMELQD